MMLERMGAMRTSAALFLGLVVSSCIVFAEDEPPRTDPSIGWRQFEDPNVIEHYSERAWPAEMQLPWVQALEIEESDLRRETADTITFAVRLGMVPLPEFKARLLTVVQDKDELAATRLSATSALLACDFQDVAEELHKVMLDAPFTMRIMIEKGLAEWKYEPVADLWLRRLSDGESDPQLFRAACYGVGRLGETEAIDSLAKLVDSRALPITKRLQAAEALAEIVVSTGTGFETLKGTSEQLLQSAKHDRDANLLVGIKLLVGQTNRDSVAILEKYADQSWGVVRATALNELLRLEPSAVVSRAERDLENSDANVRRAIVDGLLTDKSARSVALLGRALNDMVPEVRRAAREHLLAFAEDSSWKDAVIDEANGAIQSELWRSIEQAAIILTRLEHRKVRQRLVELLEHARPEVYITAAWGLKHLAEPDWAPQLFRGLQNYLARLEAASEIQVCYAATHLVEAMGMLGYRESLPTLSKMVPKGSPYYLQMRCGAIWSIGKLCDPETDVELWKAVEQRFLDYTSLPPEEPQVRAMAAVALGSMKAIGSLEVLQDRAKAEGRETMVGSRAAWAVSQITGEPMPGIPTIVRTMGGWNVISAAAAIE